MRRLLGVVLLLAMILGSSLVSQAQEQVIHVVQRGENLYRISLRYNVPFPQIAAANNIVNVNLIYVGQQIVIPGATDGGTTPPPGTPQPPTETPGGTYSVVRGDTLSIIARRFGTTVQAIATANNIANINLIFVGQVLQVPGGSGTTPPPPAAPGGFELGGHIFTFAYTDLMRSSGMTWVKQQIRWNQGEPASIAQGIINEAKSRNFKILLGVVGNPAQLAANPTQYYQDLANFNAGLASLGADAIEIWNEPNIDAEWPLGLISGAQYTQMLSASYQAIKNANPNTLVISGAPAPTGFFGGCSTNGCDDDRFIRAMAAAGAANFMDCVGMHYNSGMIPPTQTSGAPVGSPGHYSWYYPNMVNLYTSVFPNKQLCITELGYLTAEGYPALPPAFAWAQNISVQNQADWLGSVVRQARQSGRVRMLIVWNVDNTTWGADPQGGYAIVRPGGACSACNALAAAMQ